MSGASSRRKGANAEREFFGVLNHHLGREMFRRNILQTRIGGQDAMSGENPHEQLPVAVEVKRCETHNFRSWIRQALKQALPTQVPALAWRRSKEPWLVAVLMTPEQFATYARMLSSVTEEMLPVDQLGVCNQHIATARHGIDTTATRDALRAALAKSNARESKP